MAACCPEVSRAADRSKTPDGRVTPREVASNSPKVRIGRDDYESVEAAYAKMAWSSAVSKPKSAT
jgi:hypothetical protein